MALRQDTQSWNVNQEVEIQNHNSQADALQQGHIRY